MSFDATRVTRAMDIVQCGAVRTPVVRTPALDALAGGPLWLKLESMQPSGAFKYRGAYHAIARAQAAGRIGKGVVTGSSGNHGGALALAGKRLGVPVTVVMPEDAALVKVAKVKAAGARVEMFGRSSRERLGRAAELAEAEQLLMVPPYDDEDIMAGQGTTALEASEQVPDMQVFLAPVGGGGLLAGCAAYLAEARPEVEVWGCEAALADDTWRSFQAGQRIEIPLPETIADGMRNVVPGELTFPVVRSHCAGIVRVEEEDIRRGVATLLSEGKVLAEPTGAVAPAAALFGALDLRGRTAVAVVSGGNVDQETLIPCLTSPRARPTPPPSSPSA